MAVGLHSVWVTPVGGGAAVDFSCWVDEVGIKHGRDDAGSQPEASSATVDFTTTDTDPLPAVVEIGATLDVTTATGTTFSRFHGRITDLGLGWDDQGENTPYAGVGQLVAVGPLADLGRRVVGDTPWLQELDGARVANVMAAAGVILDPAYSDPGTVQILARDVDAQPALDVAQATAQSASGIVWQTRAGEIRYADANHRRGTTPSMTLDACDVLVTPTWRRTIEGLVNEVSIAYGVTPEGEEQPRYVSTRPDSVARFGRYGYTTTTELAALADAQALGEMLLVRNSSPVWVMAALPVDVAGLDAATYDQLLALDVHSLLNLTGLPAIGTAPTTAVLWVEGISEKLRWGEHELELVVSGYCRTVPAPRWDDVDPAWTWDSQRTGAIDRTNLALNPIGPTGTALGWWAVSRATQAVNGDAIRGTIADALVSGLAQRFNNPVSAASGIPCVGGETLTASIELRGNCAANLGLVISFVDAAGTFISSTPVNVVPADPVNWQRAVVTAVSPANARFVALQWGLNAGARNIGEWWEGRRALLERSAAVGTFFDGYTPDTTFDDYAWTGAASNSTSTHRPITWDGQGLPPDLTWDSATCMGPPINRGRWNDQPASLRWDQVAPSSTWDTYTGGT